MVTNKIYYYRMGLQKGIIYHFYLTLQNSSMKVKDTLLFATGERPPTPTVYSSDSNTLPFKRLCSIADIKGTTINFSLNRADKLSMPDLSYMLHMHGRDIEILAREMSLYSKISLKQPLCN